MKRLKLKLLAAKIELNWWFIRSERRQGNRLLRSGASRCSKKMLSLNRRYSRHCTRALKAQREYERTADMGGAEQRMRI